MYIVSIYIYIVYSNGFQTGPYTYTYTRAYITQNTKAQVHKAPQQKAPSIVHASPLTTPLSIILYTIVVCVITLGFARI